MAWVCGLTVASSLQILVGAFDHGVLDNVGWWWWRGAIDLVIVSLTELMTVFPTSLNAFSGGSGLFQSPFDLVRGFQNIKLKQTLCMWYQADQIWHGQFPAGV